MSHKPSESSEKDRDALGEDGSASANQQHLPEAHREYLMQRHGRVDLVPLPSIDPADPLNWPSWQKHAVLFLVSFHSMMSTFSAAAVIPAFMPFSKEFHVSIQKASYMVSVPIIFLGCFPIPWTVLSNRIGRRPVYLVSTLAAAVFHLIAAYMKSYGSLMPMRVFQAIFQATAIAIGASTVAEMFFSYQLGKKMGVWTLLSTLGPPLGPFIFGFVVEHNGWPWIFYILAIFNLATFVGFLFVGGETLFMREQVGYQAGLAAAGAGSGEGMSKARVLREKYFRFGRINKEPVKAMDFVKPFMFAGYMDVLLPTIAYSLVFCYTNVALTVLVPQTFGEKFHLNAQRIGLQFIALIIGTVIGEQVGGPFSDLVMKLRSKSLPAGTVIAEFRLVASYIGFLTSFAGLLIWGILLEHAGTHWVVGPVIGSAIAVFGLQIVTTVCITYSIQCHLEDRGAVSAFIIFVRQLWGFIGPFYFTPMLENLGIEKTAIIFAFLCLFAGMIVAGWDLWSMRRRQRV